ncbi:membrane-spanning 4-domains subfamily A member 4D-like isoform X2 [Tiliqua scincoides]|uniref:membrane-spanning 4-domains subfamily A member 4D-like isoform X2 n=1 Tax=Tiliqua scincoides TaxID=71010 RepID=UPI003462D91A
MDPKKAKELPEQLKKFYKGEPLALGITQILVGIITIVSGVVLNVADDFNFVYVAILTPYWTGVLFIISGSLSVAAARNPKPSLVKGMLGMNTVSAVAAGVAIVCLSISIESSVWRIEYECSSSNSSSFSTDLLCYETHIIPYIMTGVMCILLLFTFLELCISISNAAFGCKTVCRDTYTETVVVVYQNAPPGNIVSPPVSQ